ncbi:advanced glycosylation end product-specific receptor isoform X4 [Arvicola amphibius]|uniref:advanced glycosylation end product-specific receptor isoform X4 n=1 Tax=Arvicola amphibius TaxID=1047088 RepID=UPI0018E32CFA|nr:advanced glycosylation end product-specific receptor isoform X4 [Arvicola amphibius]
MMPAGTAAGAWVLVLALWGAAVGGQNITARIGEPLVLSCKGAPRKPPQQLEWKLNTGRTEAWKVLSPQGGPWDSVARILPNGSLLLPAIGIVDEGTFRCRAINRHGKEVKSNYRVRVYQIPGKPEIVDPASELTAGVPNKVGTCVSEGSYPAGTLSWHLDGKLLIPDGKGTIVKEETRRHPETGLFTLQSELTVTPAPGGTTHPTFSCSFSLGLPRRRPLNATPIKTHVRELVPPEGIQLLVEPEGGTVAPGGTVTLTCVSSAQPPPQIHWKKDGTPLPLASNPVLLLPEVGHEDEGIYSCVATHPSHGPQESPPVSISITGNPSTDPTPCPTHMIPKSHATPPLSAPNTQASSAPQQSCQERSSPCPLTEGRCLWASPQTAPSELQSSLRLLFVFQKQARRGRLQVRDWSRVRGKRVTAACDWGRVNKEGAGCWSCALNLPYVPTGSVGGAGLGTLALALGILGGLGMATLIVGVILWRKRQPREERKAPEHEEDEEERAELNQSEDAETAENVAGGP